MKKKTNIPKYINSSRSKTDIPDYVNSSDNKEAEKGEIGEIINRIHNEFNALFSGIGCFEGTFSIAGKRGHK